MSMLYLTVLFTLLFAASGLGVVLLIQSLTKVKRQQPINEEWLAELSTDRYRPMLRLLSDDDLRFLRSQPGFHSGLTARLRRQRCQIFRGYLRCLKADFTGVTMALRHLILQSRYDRPDLASALVRTEALFFIAFAMVHVRLVLFQWGLCGVKADGLLRLFDSMRVELRLLIPADHRA